jgi:hypothetical protein
LGWGYLRGRNLWENLGVDGRITLNGSSGSGMWGMDWIDLGQDRDRWRALVNGE